MGHDTKRKKILIVEDINDSGATLQWIKKDWESGCFPDEKLLEVQSGMKTLSLLLLLIMNLVRLRM